MTIGAARHRLSEASVDEAPGIIRDQVLPYADRKLAEYRDAVAHIDPRVITVSLGAALLLRDRHVAVTGLGDIRMYLSATQGPERKLLELTGSQGDDSTSVHPFRPGDRLVIATGGLHGKWPEQQLPLDGIAAILADGSATAKALAERFVELPRVLYRARWREAAGQSPNRLAPYISPFQATTVGALRAYTNPPTRRR